MAQVIVARRGPLVVFQRGSDGVAKIVVGNDTANAARFAGNSASSATLSQAWAEGTEPGGPGTKSAKGWAEDAASTAADLDDRIQTLPVPDPEKSLVFGAVGGAELAYFDLLGLLSVAFGVTNLPIAASDGTIASTFTAYSDVPSGVIWGIADATTRASLFAIYTDGTAYCRGLEVDQFRPDLENVTRLRAWRSGLTYLKLSGSALVHIILDGDSWWDSKNYGSTDAITRFYAESGLTNAGPGWIGFASPLTGAGAHGTALNNISVTRDANWMNLFLTDGVTPTAQNFPGYDACQATASNATITLVGSTLANCTSLTLFCGKGSGIEQSWDGSTWNAVTVTAGSGSTTATIDMTGKSNSLRLRCTNGSVVAGLFGLTGSSGVVFSNLSNSGSTAVQKAAVQANADYQAMMAALPGDTITALIQLGLNDTKAGTANETIVTKVAEVAEGYRTIFDGFPSCDIGILCQPNTFQSVQDTLAPLLRTWAYENDAMFFDWQNSFGQPAYSGDYSGYSRDYTSGAASTATPLLEVDTSYRHPSPTADLVAASKSPALSGAMVIASGLSNILLSPLRSN